MHTVALWWKVKPTSQPHTSLDVQVEGRGNGIKTNVVNNVDIARALDRPPTCTARPFVLVLSALHSPPRSCGPRRTVPATALSRTPLCFADTLKHFGCELGAQTNFDKKTGTSIVNGAHDAKKLSEVLEIFIKKYVQCFSCGNPETVIKIRRECIFLKCKACGNTSDVDMRDKLTTFILKNPPENKLSKSEAKVKKDEKERMKAAEKEARRAEKAEKKKKKEKKDEKEKRYGCIHIQHPLEHMEHLPLLQQFAIVSAWPASVLFGAARASLRRMMMAKVTATLTMLTRMTMMRTTTLSGRPTSPRTRLLAANSSSSHPPPQHWSKGARYAPRGTDVSSCHHVIMHFHSGKDQHKLNCLPPNA